MEKQDLITKVAEATGESRAAVARVIDTTLETIMHAVGKREEVRFLGFGSFKPSKRPARKARNPKDGNTITVPEKVVPKFTPGTRFKGAVTGRKKTSGG
jgi:DNA-binding protein HU-beta